MNSRPPGRRWRADPPRPTTDSPISPVPGRHRLRVVPPGARHGGHGLRHRAAGRPRAACPQDLRTPHPIYLRRKLTASARPTHPHAPPSRGVTSSSCRRSGRVIRLLPGQPRACADRGAALPEAPGRRPRRAVSGPPPLRGPATRRGASQSKKATARERRERRRKGGERSRGTQAEERERLWAGWVTTPRRSPSRHRGACRGGRSPRWGRRPPPLGLDRSRLVPPPCGEVRWSPPNRPPGRFRPSASPHR